MGGQRMDYLYAVPSYRWPAARPILDRRLAPTLWRLAPEIEGPAGTVMLAFQSADDRQILHDELERSLSRMGVSDHAPGLRALATDAVKLTIGAPNRADGWLNYAAESGPEADFVGLLNDYSLFAEGSVAAISCVHVLMQLPHDGTVLRTLSEFRRILKPGGKLYVAVPNLDLLFRMFIEPGRDAATKQRLMHYIFGSQLAAREQHRSGFDEATLRALLADAGFVRIERVERFGLFVDASEHRYLGQPISLNMTAEKAGAGD